MTASALTPLERVEDIDALLAESAERPVVIFKSSRTCGTSAWAADELHRYLHSEPVDAHYVVVTVQTHREASNAIAERLGVRHESPQIIIVRDGAVTWHGSHHRLRAETICEALTGAPAGR